MKTLIYDVETTMFKHSEDVKPNNRKGSAFVKPNKCVLHGLKWLGEESKCLGDSPISRSSVQQHIYAADIVVGFNIKFDLHWARRCDINISNINIWDCQIAEFLLENQSVRYPSLNWACDKYGISRKLDVIEEEYWSKGIDTDSIPFDILSEYCAGDLIRTEKVFLEQYKKLKGVEYGR